MPSVREKGVVELWLARMHSVGSTADDVNVGARLADNAGVGEVLASMQLVERIGLYTAGLEHRELQLKGKATPFQVAVIKPA